MKQSLINLTGEPEIKIRLRENAKKLGLTDAAYLRMIVLKDLDMTDTTRHIKEEKLSGASQ